MAQFRCDLLPIRIETARYKGEPLDEIIFNFYILNEIEDESHFLLKCVICYNTCHFNKLFTYLFTYYMLNRLTKNFIHLKTQIQNNQ